ncbi:MAG TPA: sigma-70 family RNA polymerase sigma factor [Chitinophagaceae bacterium]|jgi:RNA polymerase sigma-70 factor (ECF subfamily)|nr:sigma-70 family RNA polymerase sigma factor [Chitinophagaceae bacterium]
MLQYTDDIQLFNAFLRGEEFAIRQVYDLHAKPLCFFAQRITGDQQQAEDAVSDSFIKLLKQREQFQNLSNVKRFFYLATKNTCLDELKQKNRHVLAHQQIRFLASNAEYADTAFNEEMLRAEVVNAIRLEIDQLPDRTREVINLLFVEQLTTDQIADKLGVSVQTVRNQKSRGLEQVKSRLLKKNLLQAILYLAILFPSDWSA